jgi:hypothetical protein
MSPLHHLLNGIQMSSSKKMAVIIAIEDYHNKPHIPSVQYARNDAKAFREMLIEHFGYDEGDIVYWIDKDAGQNTLANDLPYYIQQLTEDDEFVFYYAGHGFFQDGHNRLTCWDSHHFNLTGTTVSLKDVLFDPLEKSKCQKSLIFLDCCSSILTDHLKGSRDVITDMDRREFDEFVKTGKYDAMYLSCSPGEKSSSSAKLQHGIWTYHLIKALQGQAPGAIVKDQYITSNSLQNYLSRAIPRFIREEKERFSPQTPYARIAAKNEFVIREIPDDPIDDSLPSLSFRLGDTHLRKVSETQIRKALPKGKNWSVPKFVNQTTQRFVQDLFVGESKNEIQEIVNRAIDVFELRDEDFNYGSNRDGGHIECEYFRFDLSVNQHDSDPSLAVIRREIYPLVSLNSLPTDFDSIFPNRIDELVIPIDGKINADDLIHKFENFQRKEKGTLKVEKMHGIIEYITQAHTSMTVDINAQELIVTKYGFSSPLALIRESLQDIKTLSQQNLRFLEMD